MMGIAHLLCYLSAASAFSSVATHQRHDRPSSSTASSTSTTITHSTSTTRLYNIYDDWANDLLSSSQSEYTYDELILPLDEESIEQCLEELMDSEYGKTMFGRHDVPASVG